MRVDEVMAESDLPLLPPLNAPGNLEAYVGKWGWGHHFGQDLASVFWCNEKSEQIKL